MSKEKVRFELTEAEQKELLPLFDKKLNDFFLFPEDYVAEAWKGMAAANADMFKSLNLSVEKPPWRISVNREYKAGVKLFVEAIFLEDSNT